MKSMLAGASYQWKLLKSQASGTGFRDALYKSLEYLIFVRSIDRIVRLSIFVLYERLGTVKEVVLIALA